MVQSKEVLCGQFVYSSNASSLDKALVVERGWPPRTCGEHDFSRKLVRQWSKRNVSLTPGFGKPLGVKKMYGRRWGICRRISVTPKVVHEAERGRTRQDDLAVPGWVIYSVCMSYFFCNRRTVDRTALEAR